MRAPPVPTVISILLVQSFFGAPPAAVAQPVVVDEPLVARSQAAARDAWWPAVEELGRVAARGAEDRRAVWDAARVNSVGVKFVEVRPGRFMMGPDVHRVFDARPAEPAEVKTGFFIAVTEVTNAQYAQLVPAHRPHAEASADPDSPAVGILLADAQNFCKLLSQREGCVYRLPTDTEWEYACRAGSDTQFSFGDSPKKLDGYGWYGDRAGGRAARVALLGPNAWGLFDMHGNAAEWVTDAPDVTAEAVQALLSQARHADAQGDEKGREAKPQRVPMLRGGAWQARQPLACSSTARMPFPLLERRPFSRDAPFSLAVGFRVVREAAVPAASEPAGEDRPRP